MKSIVTRPWIWVVVGLTLLGVLVFFLRPAAELAVSSEASPAAVVEPEVLSEPAPDAISMVSLQEAPALAAQQAEAGAQVVADTPSSDNCIACHTNQAVLEQLAEEPEEVVSELAAGEG